MAEGGEAVRHLLRLAAIRPDLGSVLVYDAEPAAFDELGREFAALIGAATGGPVDIVWLGGTDTEDDLWGVGYGLPAPWPREGLLTGGDDGRTTLVAVRDLPSISLAAARACTTLIGADEAHVQRHGQSRVLRPRLRWLAGCARNDLGAVSPHLLDRFALRAHGRWKTPGRRIGALRAQLEARGPARAEAGGEELMAAARRAPSFGEDAAHEVVQALEVALSAGFRRELSLARAACALAQLDRAGQVSARHVRAAVSLFRTAVTAMAPSPAGERDEVQEDDDVQEGDGEEEAPAPGTDSARSAPGASAVDETTEPETEDALQVSPVTALEAQSVSLPAPPEQEAPIAREHESLKLPIYAASPAAKRTGAPVGVRPSNTLADLAILATLLAAAPMQRLRLGRERKEGEALLVKGSDLRGYVRAAVSSELVVLLVDFTCSKPGAWLQAVTPYLARAYVERARIAVVRVGAAGAAHELRAEHFEARSILVPALAQALDGTAGKATPLADGLDRALATARAALFHGRGAVRTATVVVVSDGRGNVPLSASRAGRVTEPAGRRGIDDALAVAEALGAVDGLRCVLVDPEPKVMPELPAQLARALHAAVVPLAAPEGS
jgi:magnesium chelatase subunit D